MAAATTKKKTKRVKKVDPLPKAPKEVVEHLAKIHEASAGPWPDLEAQDERLVALVDELWGVIYRNKPED